MSDSVIKVENLSKKYTLSHQSKEHYTALRDVMANGIKHLGKKLFSPKSLNGSSGSCATEEFYALEDISFEIKQGDRVGIIGRNGAGKSTLLKILSRITEPTSGRIEITGRVASLLEVGTGFHPELTGRENIFLNGAILGMGREEIKRKFDEIVAFAEVEKFLDTPVKRYSSGMYVRLAFAVAAHLDPEILIVDEVLAVGDAQFQKKCLGKMEEVGKNGRTVLFVSHNMQAILQLCQKAILLKSGVIIADDGVDKVVEKYLDEGKTGKTHNLEEVIDTLPADRSFRLKKIGVLQNNKPVLGTVENGQPVEILVEYEILEKSVGMRVFFDLLDTQDTLLLRSFHDADSDGIPVTEPGSYRSRMVIPGNFLGPIAYTFVINAGIYNVRYCLPAGGIQVPIKVEHTSSYNKAYLGDPFSGKLAINLQWETDKII